MGNIALVADEGPSENEVLPGFAEIGYILNKKYWNQGYASKAVHNIMNCYLRIVMDQGCELAGKTVEKVSAWRTIIFLNASVKNGYGVQDSRNKIWGDDESI